MKKQLLFSAILGIAFSLTTSAQKVWDLANDTTNWPVSAGITAAGGPVVVDNLAIYPHSSSDNMAQIESSSSSFTDGFTGANRFKTNGSGGVDPSNGEYLPSVRYLKFSVLGACTIKVWCRSGGSSARSLYITDGTSLIAEQAATDSSTYYILEGSYTGGAGSIYIFGSNNFSLYKIEVTANIGTTTLSLDNASPVSTNLKAIGSKVYVSNVISKTDINIYSLTGALVKSISTTSDMNFDFRSGLYIATIKTSEGEKTMRIFVK
ncbi:T9SS type A sorting domain-containing protein [Aestuariibaculum lutulentum]|uniref:T9SS type A sorting domain-containing protein n=1 Tax=Aestuariibaculum lutulentum TaxID=2920935 RepID=A0ABS9RFJ1_9FLAO|nr:T9SS type A sorting domain-containing protein [Aestuariibaculum lutulentum]MCH4551705.1 T9SS type A sorting domain-containing protein [Aestuariibaculum lutulentum]